MSRTCDMPHVQFSLMSRDTARKGLDPNHLAQRLISYRPTYSNYHCISDVLRRQTIAIMQKKNEKILHMYLKFI